jgi:predicted nucleic acid-binding Zn ribbon protein
VKSAAPRFQLVVVPTPSEVPPEIRLKRALKCLSRSFSLRCESAVELKPADGPTMPVLAFARISGGRSAAAAVVEEATQAAACAACGAPFPKRRRWARFCSARCRLAWRTRQRREASAR